MNKKIASKLKYNVSKDFPKEGVTFIDFMPTFMDMKLLNEIAEDIKETALTSNIEVVIAPESRGYILGTLVAHKLGADLLPIRKHGKLPGELILGSYTYDTEYSKATLDLPKCNVNGKNCLFIDDVFALGGTYNASKTLVSLAGGNVLGGICLYDVGLTETHEVQSYMNSNDLN